MCIAHGAIHMNLIFVHLVWDVVGSMSLFSVLAVVLRVNLYPCETMMSDAVGGVHLCSVKHCCLITWVGVNL